jgi:hypothetical protein
VLGRILPKGISWIVHKAIFNVNLKPRAGISRPHRLHRGASTPCWSSIHPTRSCAAPLRRPCSCWCKIIQDTVLKRPVGDRPKRRAWSRWTISGLFWPFHHTGPLSKYWQLYGFWISDVVYLLLVYLAYTNRISKFILCGVRYGSLFSKKCIIYEIFLKIV